MDEEERIKEWEKQAWLNVNFDRSRCVNCKQKDKQILQLIASRKRMDLASNCTLVANVVLDAMIADMKKFVQRIQFLEAKERHRLDSGLEELQTRDVPRES